MIDDSTMSETASVAAGETVVYAVAPDRYPDAPQPKTDDWSLAVLSDKHC